MDKKQKALNLVVNVAEGLNNIILCVTLIAILIHILIHVSIYMQSLLSA